MEENTGQCAISTVYHRFRNAEESAFCDKKTLDKIVRGPSRLPSSFKSQVIKVASVPGYILLNQHRQALGDAKDTQYFITTAATQN